MQRKYPRVLLERELAGDLNKVKREILVRLHHPCMLRYQVPRNKRTKGRTNNNVKKKKKKKKKKIKSYFFTTNTYAQLPKTRGWAKIHHSLTNAAYHCLHHTFRQSPEKPVCERIRKTLQIGSIVFDPSRKFVSAAADKCSLDEW